MSIVPAFLWQTEFMNQQAGGASRKEIREVKRREKMLEYLAAGAGNGKDQRII